MLDDRMVWRPLELRVGAETEIVVLKLRRRVHPASLIAAEGALFLVAGDDVRSQLRTNRLEQVSEVPEDRKIAQNRVLSLYEVVDRHSGQYHRDDGQARVQHSASLLSCFIGRA